MNKQEIKLLLKKENPVIFEIGCADGKDTQEFINTFKDLEIHCFEPEPKNITIIESTINYAKHRLFKGVISNVTGKVTFNRSRTDNPNDLSYSGSIRSPKKHVEVWPFIKFDEKIEVKSTTLDDYCDLNGIDRIDYIWADVQGAESDMIAGGKKSFSDRIKFLYTEYSNEEYYEGQANLKQILSSLGTGWDLLKDFGTDALFINTKI